MMKSTKLLSFAACAALALAACGDDDDDAADQAPAATTEAPAAATEAPATTAAATTAAPATTEAPATTAAADSADDAATATTEVAADPYCALAEEIAMQESPPSAEQLTRYQELAPPEIADAVATLAPALITAGDDMVAFYAAFAEDDAESASAQIDAYETEACGIAHDDGAPPDGTALEVEDGAARVDVTATDYAFDVPAVEAGRTSFVLTNQGHEAHFLYIVKLADGVTLDEAMQASDPTGVIEGEWET